ncbi:MAG: hypothetical protein WBP13_05625 [Methylophilaceae bacterium]
MSDPIVSGAYSSFDSDIVSFHSAEALNEYISHELHEKNTMLLFSVYYPDTQGFREVRKITLIPEKCDGHTYRYAVGGWGVIRFHLKRQLDNTLECYFGVSSEKRANTWLVNVPEFMAPNLWHWKLVEKHIRR